MYGSRTGPRASAVAGMGALLLLSGCSSSDGGETSGDGGKDAPAAVGQQPEGDDPYWVNPDGNAARQVAAYVEDGEKKNAELIRKIAEQPVGEWIAPENARETTKGFTQAAEQAGREALLVLYNIPHRDCGQFSKGGAADGDAYRTWLEDVAQGIGDRPATVVLEPDALLHLVDGCTPQESHEERYDLLKGAVERLKQQPAAKVYIDAGNAGWQTPDALDEPLRRAGIAAADGFAVNVSNFETTEASRDFGKRLSAKVGGKPFVIDTSRNGNGPYEGGDPAETWCNPPGRALGEPPTTETGDELVDAYLWVKRPGESDGDCKGGPKAGDWWPEYALGLARATK
ncbi:glycoside hydrolase family 6 protein [Streptomyces sp. NBC_00059]|uniref:glycoside hydrolase family 6 protein n=1 Tax=Streptomyces sp. NBC_00059 TaxID=2975635 RepID=UPI002258CAFD|nr:glycoside hydrolase family 6 protein [Streptomyces sp. NBC_00059]MCX5412370.1 glycoside hydrolase family 6 protein [Streptomyces sp. NBC_00059]